MQGDLNLSLSNFLQLKPSCHPHPKHPRRPSQQAHRYKNKSALQGRQLQLSCTAATPKITAGTSQLNSRYKKILRDKKLSYQRKFSDTSMQELKLGKLATDSSMHEQNRAGSSGFERKQKTSHFFDSFMFKTKTSSPKRMLVIKKEAMGERYRRRESEEQDAIDTSGFEILTITKLSANQNIKKYYNRLIEVCVEKQERVKRDSLRVMSPAKRFLENQQKIDFFRYSKNRTVNNLKGSSASDFFKKKPTQVNQQEYNEIDVVLYNPLPEIELSWEQIQGFDVKTNIFGKAFSITHCKDDIYQVVHQNNSTIRMEIASLTKIMTCLVVLLISDKFKLNLKTSQAVVSTKASQIQGTSARLQSSDVIQIHDLLHGLMLPSGNDAALALAQWGGKTIRQMCFKKYESISPRTRKNSSKLYETNNRSPMSLFIYHMNAVAKALRLRNTRFANPHGLMNKKNYSCSDDLTKLCIYAMQREDFRRIVAKRQHNCTIYNRKYASQREVIWNNTNKLLKLDGFVGIKTGITPSAGPCLASCFSISPTQHIYIVLLNTLTIAHRFDQSKKLLLQTLKQLYANTGLRSYLTKLQTLSSEIVLINQQEPVEDSNNFEPSDESDAFDEDAED